MEDWDPLGVLGARGGVGGTAAAAAAIAVSPSSPSAAVVDVSTLSTKSAVADAAARSPFLDWPARRGAILREFTVLGKMAFRANAALLKDGEAGAGGEEDPGEGQNMPLAKARQRLEALEAASKGIRTVEMSQADYEQRIRTLNRALSNAWESGHRVASLKIAIQCAKLLGEDRVPTFYPSAFVLVTEILDSFGTLVFSRLKAIADDEHRRISGPLSAAGKKAAMPPGLPEDFIAADVGSEARETAKNWMYKVS